MTQEIGMTVVRKDIGQDECEIVTDHPKLFLVGDRTFEFRMPEMVAYFHEDDGVERLRECIGKVLEGFYQDIEKIVKNK